MREEEAFDEPPMASPSGWRGARRNMWNLIDPYSMAAALLLKHKGRY